MRETLVIFRRELKSYFLSPIAYVFGAIFLVVVLAVGAAAIEHGGQATMQGFFLLLPLWFTLKLSGLTMRLWAEERKLGTIELLMTFPVTVWQLVMGKFLATLAYLAFVLVLTLGLPLTLGAFGRLDWTPVLAAYFATLLFASSYVAVGMFWSTVTRDQLVALLLSLASLLVLYFLGYPALIELLAGSAPALLVDLLNGISPYKYFESITRGVLDTRDIVYFACFCGFFLYANTFVLEARRRQG
jgi:ABC-2 type transport system permease protein